VSPAPGPTFNDLESSISEALAPVSAATGSAPAPFTTVPAATNGPLATAQGNAAQSAALKAAVPTQIAMEEANRQARTAVANVMAKMNTTVQTIKTQPKPFASGNAVKVLTKKVGEM
jgi:hypothetical protein